MRERIDAACDRAGRSREDVRLVAISKTKPAADVLSAADAGQTLFGENRVQEALGKQAEISADFEWHLVGPLQRNKARHAVGAFALLHGVDNSRLVDEIDRRAEAAGTTQRLLLQVRLGGEATKFGVDPEGLAALLDHALGCENVEVRGLMTIPPPVECPDDARRWFAELCEIREAHMMRAGVPMPELSMGMTSDFEVAIEEGATIVRVGTALFGPRG